MSTETQANNKRLAKNTILLYFRMLIIMLLSLYTSRVVLNALGIEDYGVYNVIGGLVTVFSIMSSSLSAAIVRYITYEMGTGNKQKLQIIFSTAIYIQVVLAIVVVIVAELIGVWFLNEKMNIPINRIFAANWVFQFSIIAFAINLINIPFNSAIIAHENMRFYAISSIIHGLLLLLAAISITVAPTDKLIWYALMMAITPFLIFSINVIYCRTRYSECRLNLTFDRYLLTDMSKFAGWNFIGASSSVLRDHGGNIIINLFCGPAVNAARGVSMEVHKAVVAFSSSFTMALNPQITKTYASDDREYALNLVMRGARFSFFLQLIVCIPLLLNTDFILHLWLKTVPVYSVVFVQLILVFGLLEVLSAPLVTLMLATGNIKKYQIIVGGLQLLNLPLSYLALRLGLCPENVLIIAIILGHCCLFARLVLLHTMTGLNIRSFLKDVYIRVLLISIISVAFPYMLNMTMSDSWLRLISVTVVSIVFTCVIVMFVGCTKNERLILQSKIVELKSKIALGK